MFFWVRFVFDKEIEWWGLEGKEKERVWDLWGRKREIEEREREKGERWKDGERVNEWEIDERRGRVGSF